MGRRPLLGRRRRLVVLSADEHGTDVLQRAQVRKRIAVDEEQVGTVSGSDPPGRGVQPQRRGRFGRRHVDDRGGRQAQVGVKRESRDQSVESGTLHAASVPATRRTPASAIRRTMSNIAAARSSPKIRGSICQ